MYLLRHLSFLSKKYILSLNGLAICFSFLMTLTQVLQQWQMPHPGVRFLEYWAFNNFLFLGFSVTRVTFRIFLFIYSLALGALWAIKAKMGIDVGFDAVAALFEATREETVGFLHNHMLGTVFLVLFLLVIVALFPFSRRDRTSWKNGSILFALSGVMLLGVSVYDFSSCHANGRQFHKVIPNNFFVGSKEYLKMRYHYAINSGPRDSITSQFVADGLPEDLTVVLIIGESVRSDRLGINGYARDTTPELAKLKGLLTWPDATACGVSTSYAVPCLFVRTSQEAFRFPLKEQSLISVLHDFGFSTHYISMQNTYKNPTIYQICREAEDCRAQMDNATDELLPSLFKEALQADTARRRLFVLHQMGSHWIYASRYPRSFAYFQPDCKGSAADCSTEETDNAYDNTIRYTDFIISSIIHSLEHKKALVIFTSDHGEALGEYGRFGHGSLYALSLRVQKSVPFFMWFSPPLLRDKTFAQYYAQATRNQKSGKMISHDYFFYTVLGCSGIRGHDAVGELDLCHSSQTL